MANQIDLTPATKPGIHVHVPAGQSASAVNNPSDFPPPSQSGKQTIVTVNTPGAKVRFANPS